jgi:energy-converting hydrogenase Eha subunit B
MQIKADLKAGQTLAQIANATPGKSAAGLVAAIMASLKTKLDAAVTAGKLSATTESAIMTRLNTKVTAVVNGQWHWWWHRHA